MDDGTRRAESPDNCPRLVASDTIEERIVQLHHAERDPADSLLEGTDTAHTLTADELIDLLRNR